MSVQYSYVNHVAMAGTLRNQTPIQAEHGDGYSAVPASGLLLPSRNRRVGAASPPSRCSRAFTTDVYGGRVTETTDQCCAPPSPTEPATSCCGPVTVELTAPIRDRVRDQYAAVAQAAAGSACCGTTPALTREQVFGSTLYADSDTDGAPAAAVTASLGCGVPTAVADLQPGETVLDLGSGAGADVLISARRVGPTGRAIGLDMTPEMLTLARDNAETAGVTNVEFLQGYLEDIPLPDDAVDVIISNCVINLAADKAVVLAEAFRVLRPGGRFAISDVVLTAELDEATAQDFAQWTGCISGALTVADYEHHLAAAGFTDIAIDVGHSVHAAANSAIVRATKP